MCSTTEGIYQANENVTFFLSENLELKDGGTANDTSKYILTHPQTAHAHSHAADTRLRPFSHELCLVKHSNATCHTLTHCSS